ncbi:MAG TPA: competence/damage-inducible protein A [Muricauda sp.]|uniref:CinA-like protein n=1 Tax=Flagellimonas aurea TaxID=2915619 RepID=A0ABS3G5X3_9FLAO|nr:competence/damage-inducible protein A [Allomuricauda aurea]MAO17287.1 competence/damage-inducible protein A [Allomuricauda sp.]MBC71765.1 competence/damage-inducible protein A [Allomuricauda sp.]MBO0354809.1 competence/damage-inducible protein A [Allomuricauda aurea]HBU77234.1 competence/damage-inducible protein A [Allomuricauda sp.]|tara:strand:+ start:5167 stop:6417 length:1251 start_codon:yes stop_codon:yes gene_type:complete
MQAEIITIGDEILIGQIVDTNSAFISKELNKIGVSVYQITSIQDDKDHILRSLKEAGERSSVVIITGGLGPTKDDVTKHTLCEFFEDELVRDDSVLHHIEELFKKYITTPISDLNREQAMVPSKATVLHNEFGTAPGIWMKKGETAFVSLPGVPYEMKNLMTSSVLPKIKEEYKRPHIVHKTILTYGMGESAIAEKLEDWENNLPPFIKFAYLPNIGSVRLRLSAKGEDKDALLAGIEEQVKKLYPIIGEIIYGEEEEDGRVEKQIGTLLTDKKMTLSTAESFTGGSIAERITSVPGASAYFKGSIVCYATETKVNVLGVPQELIDEYSVVSEEVAIAMANGVKNKLGTDFSIATTGNAGPTKGDSDAEVGTVYIGIGTPKGTFAHKFVMGKHRDRVVKKSVNKAFELLYKEILNF